MAFTIFGLSSSIFDLDLRVMIRVFISSDDGDFLPKTPGETRKHTKPSGVARGGAAEAMASPHAAPALLLCCLAAITQLAAAVAPAYAVSPCQECESPEAKGLWWKNTGLNCPSTGPVAGVLCDICTTTNNAAVCSTAKTSVTSRNF